MKPILIFRHIAFEGPGYLGKFLARQDIPFEIVAVDEGTPVVTEPENVSGLVFMGGPMSVNDDLDWIRAELALIQSAYLKNIPILGHCLGAQLISKALGARVKNNPVKEIGWYPVQVVDNEIASDWFRGLPEEFMVYHWHGETFELPKNAIPLLKNRFCSNQGYICGNALALQCHIEMQGDMIAIWSEAYADEIRTGSESIQTATEMQEDIESRIRNLNQVAETIYSNWSKMVLERVNLN